ncbi:cytidylyltransferase domain-containing protein, partial [Streptomyces sp. NPDC012935]|uniref:cytidylyltransferase domain-containing protein n=1 Tax=Streptomyces sp. NPDC012935 TaxID=3364857 RepID=UPI00369CB14A
MTPHRRPHRRSHPQGDPMSDPAAGPGASTRRVLAVIPARGGSKSVPAKNLAPVGGVPLVVRAVRECRASRLVTDVVV